MLSVRNVNKSFGARQILRDINLDIAPGSITCAIGPSGTGKTTLLRAMALLELPDSGAIQIDDQVYDFGPTVNKTKAFGLDPEAMATIRMGPRVKPEDLVTLHPPHGPM